LLVSSEEHVEPLEVRPAVKVGSFGYQNLLHGFGVIDDNAFGGTESDAENVAVFLLKT